MYVVICIGNCPICRLWISIDNLFMYARLINHNGLKQELPKNITILVSLIWNWIFLLPNYFKNW